MPSVLQISPQERSLPSFNNSSIMRNRFSSEQQLDNAESILFGQRGQRLDQLLQRIFSFGLHESFHPFNGVTREHTMLIHSIMKHVLREVLHTRMG
jgi:hypothetical protein